MITAVIVTNLLVAKTLCASGVASGFILGCHWFRGVASRLERGGKA